jgi:hypothetical protein
VLVVLAGCGGLPFGGSDNGTPTLAEVAESTDGGDDRDAHAGPNDHGRRKHN